MPSKLTKLGAACQLHSWLAQVPLFQRQSMRAFTSLEAWHSAARPINEAATPPSSWYLATEVARLEEQTVFRNSWQMVGHVEQLAGPGSFFAGTTLNTSYLVCRDAAGTLQAFHNVCRHHAAPVAYCDEGHAEQFQCRYHGWTYGLDGRLLKATRLKGIKNFRAADMGLVPIQAAVWGQLVLLRLGGEPLHRSVTPDSTADAVLVQDWLGDAHDALQAAGMADELTHVAMRTYDLDCNWKVFVDNYLDGGYHVPFAHPRLAGNLDIKTYASTLFDRVSIQGCQPAMDTTDDAARLGDRDAAYAFIYPNLMINRYGPWMDTNLVIPLGVDRCKVVFNYFLDPAKAKNEQYIKDSLRASDEVQQEDAELCAGVTRGLRSPAYDTGRYAPGVETPMFHFHQLLHRDLITASQGHRGEEHLTQAVHD